MSIFAPAIDDLFADPNLAADAVFLPDGGEPVPIRVIARRPDRVLEFGGAQIHAETAMLEVRVSEVPDPRPGDRIEIADEAFLIQGVPIRDRERLVWIVDLRPA